MQPITLAESSRFVALEKIIERGQKTFVEVGTALAEIRDSKLYRSDFDTFESYLKSKWGFEKRYAQYLIASAEVVHSLPEQKRTIVRTETQARALAKVPAPEREAVLEKAVEKAESEERPLTAKDIKESAPLDFPDPEAETQPPSTDEKWKNAFGGKLPDLSDAPKPRELSENEKELKSLAEGVWGDADMIWKDLPTLDAEQLEAIDATLTDYRKLIRAVAKERKAK